MKQLELELKKRLLIVEVENCDITIDKDGIHFYFLRSSKKFIPGNFHQICKGSELTEEIAKELVKTKRIKNVWDDFMSDVYTNYEHKDGFIDQYKTTALESFISAIEAKGHYWGENPVKRDNIQTDDGTILNIKYNSKEWQEAESKTFNPEKILIFEIL